MASGDVVRVAFVGCGNVAEKLYAPTIAPHRHIELAGATDLDAERARKLVAEFGGRAYGSIDEILADDTVDVVVVLTTHQTHEELARRALDAGKHAFSEKPLTLTYEAARSLVDLARERRVRLGAAPSTFQGEAQETAWKVIREGRLGTLRLAYAEVNWGRIESWHAAPQPFYEVGPLFDVGVYPLTVLTSILGRARRAAGYAMVLKADRVALDGQPFSVETPDFGVSMIEFDSGVLVRLTTDFYVGRHSKQDGIEFHGDDASLNLASWVQFDAPVEVAQFGGTYEPVPFVADPFRGVEWARGLIEMATAILEDRPHRATGEQAAHVVEILCAITASWRENGAWVDIRSTFTPPAPTHS